MATISVSKGRRFGRAYRRLSLCASTLAVLAAQAHAQTVIDTLDQPAQILANGVGLTVTGSGSVVTPGFRGVFGQGDNLVTVETPAVAGGGRIQGGSRGVEILLGSGAVDNSGEIAATSATGIGVALGAGGTVDNSGTVAAALTSVRIRGGDAATNKVTNSGTLQSTGAFLNGAVHFDDVGGAVDNQAGGIISGGRGVDIEGAGMVMNAGQILGNGSNAVTISGGGLLNNASGGTVRSNGTAVMFSGALGEIVNGGLIESTGALSVTATAGGSIDNSGRIVSGVLIQGGSPATNTVVNRSGAEIAGNLLTGVQLAGGNVTNHGVITGASGVNITGAGGILLNTGSIGATGAFGTAVSVASGSTIDNSGSITSDSAGAVNLGFGAATTMLTNRTGGEIIGGAGGASDAILVSSSFAIDNDGLIRGQGTSPFFDPTAIFGFGVAGTIINRANGVIENQLSGVAVEILGAAVQTFDNAGMVNGDVRLNAGNDIVVLRPGSVINGRLDGGGDIDSLELAAPAGQAGTLDLDVTTVAGFDGETATKTGAGSWTLTGEDLTFSPLLDVTEGLLIANANTPGLGVTVQADAVLGGSGTLGDVMVVDGGTVTPGESVGTLNTGNFVLAGTIVVEIDAAGGADTVDVTGTVDITGSALDLRISGDVGGLPIFSAHTIIANDGTDPVTGTFASGTGLNGAGDLFSAANTSGGTGNDVDLEIYRTSVLLHNNETNAEIVRFPTDFTGFTFTVDGTDQALFSGAFAETATPVGVTKAGTGTLVVSGANSYSGDTVVSGGALINNGTLASAVVVNAGRYGGSGSSAGLTANSGSTIAPGNSIGTLTVAGDTTFDAGSVFEVEVAGDGSGDLLDVSGKTTLLGGTVSVVPVSPDTEYADGTRYTVIASGGGVEGRFAGIIDPSAFLDFALAYDADNVFLTVTGAAEFASVAQTANQFEIAGALQNLDTTAGSDGQAVRDALLGLDAAGARTAFGLIQGEIHADDQVMAADAGGLFNAMLMAQAGAAGSSGTGTGLSQSSFGGGSRSARPANRYTAWAGGLGASTSVDGDGNAAEWNSDSWGAAGGLQFDLGGPGDAIVGIGGGYSRTSGDIPARSQSADIDSYHVGVYGRTGAAAGESGPSVTAAASYAFQQFETTRTITFAGIARTAAADYDGHTVAAAVEARYGFAIGAAGSTVLSPLVGIEGTYVSQDGFSETGAGALNLSSGGETFSQGALTAGLSVGGVHTLGGLRVRPVHTVAYEHVIGEAAPSATLALAGSPTPFVVRGPGESRNRLRLRSALTVDFSDTAALNLSAGGIVSSDRGEFAANAAFRVRF